MTPLPTVNHAMRCLLARIVTLQSMLRVTASSLYQRVDGTAIVHRLAPIAAIALLVLSMGGKWHLAGAAPRTIAQDIAATTPPQPERPPKKSAQELKGKINLNTATEEQLMRLPTVGPAKAERIVTWRKKNGGFRRIADIRRVKGFGYKTFKRLEPFLEIKGETTLE